jgi:hypothetical protein
VIRVQPKKGWNGLVIDLTERIVRGPLHVNFCGRESCCGDLSTTTKTSPLQATMSRKSGVGIKSMTIADGAKALSMSQEVDSVRKAIESGIVDPQIISALKRVLSGSATGPGPTIGLATTKSGLTSARRKTMRLSTRWQPENESTESFPSTGIISAAKTVVMKSLTALATELERRVKKSDAPQDIQEKSAIPQRVRNVAMCCKVALESLRQWQGRVDVGSGWVNKAYIGYISKLISLEMVCFG